jgi:multiple sugar transport system permease protein
MSDTAISPPLPTPLNYGETTPERQRLGSMITWGATALLAAIALYQTLFVVGYTGSGFVSWRPVLYAYGLWGIALGFAQVVAHGEQGKRALFILPAILFTVAMVIFPTLFGFYIALTDWNLASQDGMKFNGLDNFWQMLGDPFFRNALLNMVFYVGMVLIEYVIAFGLAMLLNAQIGARKFFRVAFLMPLMLSPVAVSWMVGKSMMETRFGPLANFAKWVGWENPAFFQNPWMAKMTIQMMDAWTFIPFIMIMLLAGLQALPKDVIEASQVDGANKWQQFWGVIFPLMIPVSITAIVLRIIFKLKIADIIINVTSGGPGGATDSVTSFIFREYRDRSNVGYGTMMAMTYLILIIVFITLLLKVVDRWRRSLT